MVYDPNRVRWVDAIEVVEINDASRKYWRVMYSSLQLMIGRPVQVDSVGETIFSILVILFGAGT